MWTFEVFTFYIHKSLVFSTQFSSPVFSHLE